MEIIDAKSAARFIRWASPDWVWLLKHIESEDGYVRFPPLFTKLISNLNIGNYPELYEDERRIGAMMLLAFLTPEEIKELDTELVTLPLNERGDALFETLKTIQEAATELEIPRTPEEQRAALESYNALSEKEKREGTVFIQRFMMAFLAGFYQALSIMVHGESLTALVAQAKAGKTKAFAQAVQIDKHLLTGHSFFKQRYVDAQLNGERDFIEEVGSHLRRPPYKGKIRHKALYLAFSFLDQVGVLATMKHSELLDLCNEAGLDAHGNRIDDVKNLTKRLEAFRSFQRRGIDLSTP